MKTYRTFLTPQPKKIAAACAAGHSVCVTPNMLDFAAGDIASFAGYPTGNHHQLVKASEARLAAQQGARLIIAVPSIVLGDTPDATPGATRPETAHQTPGPETATTGDTITTISADTLEPLMAEFVLLREAVPHPTTLAIVVDTQIFDDNQARTLATIAKTSGADAICTGVVKSRPSAHQTLASILPVIGIGDTPESAQDATIWLNTGN